MKRVFSLSALAFSLSLPTLAHAQFGGPGGMAPPGGGMGGPRGMTPGGKENSTEEGPAEEAPEDEKEQSSDLAPLGGYAGQSRRARKVIEVDGYFRFRTDYFYKLHLNQTYAQLGADRAPPPFPLPLECDVLPENATSAPRPCGNRSFGNGNLRLRLEPTINITDQVRVQTQIDVLDNVIAGSTADSLANFRRPGERSGRAPLSALYTTQDPPEIGQNSLISSIRAKRAWGEVETEFGTLFFGRMPWHFGRGMSFNNGNCPDCEGGTSVDRVMAVSRIYGHQLSLAYDFGAQGYNIGHTDIGRRDPNGLPLDLAQSDDVLQLMASIVKHDDERRFRDRASAGEVMVNYGTQVVFRQQDSELQYFTDPKLNVGTKGSDPASQLAGAATAAEMTPTREQLALTKRINAMVFLPSVWFKMAWKTLTVEAEANAVLGKIGNGSALMEKPNADNPRLVLRQLGWVVASDLRLLSDTFVVGFETGGATGDQAENRKDYLNYRFRSVKQPEGDHRLSDFKFSPDYQVDQIFFRRIMGTVSNAIYFKPQLTYWMNLAEPRQLGINASAIYSLAPVPVSTPGNSISYGAEVNLGLHYRNPGDGFYAGFSWAVFWPLGALDRSTGLWGSYARDAEASQAVRTYMGIRF